MLRMCVCVDCGWMCGGGEWMCVDVCVSVIRSYCCQWQSLGKS